MHQSGPYSTSVCRSRKCSKFCWVDDPKPTAEHGVKVVNISLYHMEATVLCHSRDLPSLKPPCCTFSPISILASQTLNSISFHFMFEINMCFFYKIFGYWF
jgi:hypothetical protein